MPVVQQGSKSGNPDISPPRLLGAGWPPERDVVPTLRSQRAPRYDCFTVLRLTFGFICTLVIVLWDIPCLSGQAGLSCATVGDPTGLNAGSIYEGSSREAQEIRNAPHPAARVDKHTLEIHWQRGVHVFRDRPPFDEQLDGIEWAYCGYSPQLKMHLIREQDVDVFTGVLLDDATGAILQAGETVVFSPDARLYLAYEQPDGQDGATLKLYDREGHLLWKGFDGLLSADGKSVIADFQTVRWIAGDHLLAEYTLSGAVHKMILSRSADGKWLWPATVSE